MKLRLDTSKTYAIALEGGGAKGAYEVGVWRALDEADVRFDAVAGTSVGALNGAMMVMGELEQALRLWENIRFSQVFDADDEQLKKLYDHKLSEVDFRTLFKDVMEAIHEGGLDIEPLRRLIAEWVDEEKIRSSPKKLFLVTYSLTDKRELRRPRAGAAGTPGCGRAGGRQAAGYAVGECVCAAISAEKAGR